MAGHLKRTSRSRRLLFEMDKFAGIKDSEGKVVDLYVPRKW